MEQYDEKAWYKFTDKDGNVHYSRGDNGYIWQAYTEGIPLSVNDKGEWYTEPYLEVTPNGFVSHIPDWFKDTKEYTRWMDEFVPQLTAEGPSITADRFSQYKDMLSSLGSMGGTRQSYRKFIENYGVTDRGLQDSYVDTMYAVQLEGKEKEKAQISGIFGSDQIESAEDIARSFKNLSKEKLAQITTKLYWNMDKAKDGSKNLSQKEIADAVTTMGILSYIDENYKEFGDGEEFKGLLEASEWQKFARQLKSFQQTWAESGIWGIGARFMYGIGEVAEGRDFSLRIEDDRERSYLSPAFGGSLKGLEASDRIGNIAGMAASIATQIIVSKGAGYLFNGKIMPMLNLGEKWSKVGTFLQTVPGAMTSDFILNDVPIDGLFAVTDLMKYGGDWGKVWENPEEQQNLIPIPGIGELGPKVPAGLKYNLLGDVIVDLALPVVNIVFGNFHNKLDLLSNGGLTRVEDKIALQNLKLQQKLTDLPVVGTGWKKFVNFMMGEADAEKVRLARKAAIAEGSMRPYEEVHNLLTLNNHEGAEVVNPMLKKLDKDYKISESVQDFVKNKNQYGGIGETKVAWKDIEPGTVKKGFKGYDDILPRNVKQGLLDIERLSELKGEAADDGGIFSNPARGAEIEKLENKVKKLPKKIREFADRFSNYNKAMDQLRVKLGLTTQQWEDALQADPRWEKYMTRQALVPGGGGPGTGTDPTQAKIITKGRKGYYAENYLDPYIAVNMKGVALGRAYAWNEMKKALYSYEAALGNVIAGKGGASTAAKLAEKRAEIKSKEELKKAVEYDSTIGSFSTDMSAISGSFRRISELLDRPGEISLKSVYGATQNPQIKAIVNDFNNGKIQFAPGVKEAAGLTDSVAADIIQNTYAYNKVNPIKTETPKAKDTPAIPRDSTDVWNDRMARDAFDTLRNKDGEIDAGQDGLTFSQVKKRKKTLEAQDEAAVEKWQAENRAAFDKYHEEHDAWLEGMKKYLDEEWEKWTPEQKAEDPFAEKIYDEYKKNNPEPQRPEWTEYPDSSVTGYYKRRGEVEYRPEQLVDSPASMDYIVYAVSPKEGKSENNFNYLTRGENRRALYKKGYDNLDAKTKAQVDKADAGFTQRLKEDTVLYRGESFFGTLKRNPKVGDKLDSSSWTYTQLLPEQTAQYRHGGTANTLETMFNVSEGTIYRLHTKAGTPVFYAPAGGKEGSKVFGGRTEFILPRGIDMTVTGIKNGFLEPFVDDEGKSILRTLDNPKVIPAKIIDVEVDATNAIAPSLTGMRDGMVDKMSVQGADMNIPDNLPKDMAARVEAQAQQIGYNAGMSVDGVPYKYEIENGQITKMEKITDIDGLAESVRGVTGTYDISTKTVESLGEVNVHAINRALIKYRDNIPVIAEKAVFKVGYDEGSLGWCPKVPDTLHIENGKLVADEFEVFLSSNYYAKGKEESTYQYQKSKAGNFHPKNSGDLSSTPIHENGHSTSGRLTISILNQRLEEGNLDINRLQNMSSYALKWFFIEERDKIQADILKTAAEKIGVKPTPANINTQRKTISGYANYDKELARKNSETIAEAFTDYFFNGADSSPFSQAIVGQFKERMNRFTVAAAPGEVFAKNNLTAPKGLFNKEGHYSFPTKKVSVKKTEVYTPKPLLGQQKPVSFHDTMYHGSGKVRAEIYTSAQVPILGKGKYWAFSESNAKHFGDKVETKEVSLKNPLTITSDDEWREIAKLAGWEFPNPIGLDEATVTKYTDDLRKMVTESGYDGVIIRMSPTKDTSLLYDVFGVPQVVEYGVDVKTKVVGEENVDSMSDAQKAEWLDQWRQKNPYLKGELTEETYRQANLWDTFFQKEIAAYDAKTKSVAPDLLIEKNANFLENLSKSSAKMLVQEIKQASIEGFDEALATMALSKKSTDIADAMDEFIINRVEKAANEIASKMPGGVTEENLNTARITLWSEDSLKNDVVNMVYSMVPNGELAAVQEKIGKLFKTQAEGYASFEALPVDVRKLYGEEKRLQEQLARDNKYALQKGKEEDAGLKEQGYRNGSKVVSFRDGGETVYVVLNDPLEASLFERPNNYKETNVFWESVAQMSNFLARTYRLGTTGMNPVALVRNILRDPLQATLTAGFSPLSMHLSPDVFFHTLRGYGLDDATISDVSEKIKNWAGSSTLTQEIRNFSNTKVGSTGYRSKTEKYIKKFNQAATENKIVKLGEKPLEMWESMFRTQVGQQSFMRNYQRTRDVNKALGAALFDTSNATTNFSHSVAHLRRATSTIPYLTSAINGSASFWRLFNMNPVRMIARLTAGFMVPAMAITAWNLSDKEKRQAYLNLPEWFRQGHIVLLDNENNVFALPIPEEIDQFYNVARKYIEFTQESTPFALPTIMAQGVFGFLPLDVDGFFGDDGSIQIGRGVAQLANGIMPQAATAIYELVAKENLFTGQDISDYDGWNTFLNTTSNIFGTGWKQVINSIGLMCGVPESRLVGKSVENTLARDLFGVGFDDATTQFMKLVGKPSEIDPDTGKETKATGLFAESEDLAKKIEKIEDDIIFASEEQKAELEKKKQDLINDFTQRVANMTNKYMQLYTVTGGLEDWKKKKIVQILTLGQSISSGDSLTYQYNETNQAGMDERGLALQRYVDAGLPAQADRYSFADSIDLQAAVNRFYGTNKQATQDFKNAVEQSGMKDVKDEFYSVINQIYDAAEEQNKQPDYDLIKRIQARYLQMMDSALIPLINQYGINVLNNNDFIDAVRRQVNGMIPSDDWRQSAKNAKRFLSTKEFPTATVDVKKWLKNRYSSGMRDRGLDSDPEVTERLESIRNDIDAGRMGAAKGKIDDLKKGVNRANFYISSKDLMTLNDLQNMVK